MLPPAELKLPICLHTTHRQDAPHCVPYVLSRADRYAASKVSSDALFELRTKATGDSKRQTDEVHCSFVKNFFGRFIAEGGINASSELNFLSLSLLFFCVCVL